MTVTDPVTNSLIQSSQHISLCEHVFCWFLYTRSDSWSWTSWKQISIQTSPDHQRMRWWDIKQIRSTGGKVGRVNGCVIAVVGGRRPRFRFDFYLQPDADYQRTSRNGWPSDHRHILKRIKKMCLCFNIWIFVSSASVLIVTSGKIYPIQQHPMPI